VWVWLWNASQNPKEALRGVLPPTVPDLPLRPGIYVGTNSLYTETYNIKIIQIAFKVPLHNGSNHSKLTEHDVALETSQSLIYKDKSRSTTVFNLYMIRM